MAGKAVHAAEKQKASTILGIPFSELAFLPWAPQEGHLHPGGLFASVGQMGGVGFGVSPPPPAAANPSLKIPHTSLYVKYLTTPELGYHLVEAPASLPEVMLGTQDELLLQRQQEEAEVPRKKKGKARFKLKLKVDNPSLRRLISGGIAGAVSRTAVAPLETIRTLLMVGSGGHSASEVLNGILKVDGWKGLFRGNLVNVIRVTPSKAIELFAFDTVKKALTPQTGEPPNIPLPPSLIAGACAGVSSTICTYPLELMKTRFTVQRDAYNNIVDCFSKILREEGPAGLYRGLVPSIFGVIPYAATNYFAYDVLRKAYKKTFKTEEVGNVATLLIGSTAAALSSTTTFPLEVARKHLQVGAVGGRQVYKNLLHAMASILEKEGIEGLYRGLGPSYMKLVPAAGISFMCYEACKKILVEKEDGQ